MTGTFEVRFSREAKRALLSDLPEKIAIAAFEFIVGPMAESPKRVGKQLCEPLLPLFSARRGAYRVIDDVDDQAFVIRIVAVEHRSDVYRRR